MISEPVLDFWVVLKVVSVIQCLFFSTLILTTKNENPGAQKFLLLFLLAFALLETDEMFFYSRYIYQIPHWVGLADPLAYCLAPLLYLYTSSLTNSRFSLKKHHLYYFLPLPVLYFSWIPAYLKSGEEKVAFLFKILNQEVHILEVAYPYNLFFWTVFLAIFSGFLFLAMSIYKLYKFNVSIKQLYSSIDAINLKWLKFLLILSSFIWLSASLSLFFDSQVLSVIDLVAFPVFIFFISYYDLRQKRIPVTVEGFAEKDPAAFKNSLLHKPTVAKEDVIKYAKSRINEEMLEELSGRLMQLVEHEKVYTKNDLSLQELADLLETSTHHLSQLLNEKMNQSFYEFINFHRVQEVMRKLALDECKHLKVLAIAFDAGFNSKTTFNAAFKKYSGLSPTEYKKGLESSKTLKIA